MLLDATPAAVYERARAILTSGVMQGGRFVLREANNLPPRVPVENLAAMYRACLDYGNYGERRP
jgi:uroporphyrinogen-III decarboxylase